MTGKTHRLGGMLCSVVGFELLRQKGLLLPDVNVALQWLAMYPFCMWGSTASDLDHHWESCPSHDMVSFGINKLLHLTKGMDSRLSEKLTDKEKQERIDYKVAHTFNAHHRSWQTHSDLTLFVVVWLIHYIMSLEVATYDTVILSLILMGIALGVTAHFILDILTPEGITSVLRVAFNWVYNLSAKKRKKRKKTRVKVSLVPNKEYFATGGKWETFIQKLLKVLTVLAVLYEGYIAFSPYLPYSISLGG